MLSTTQRSPGSLSSSRHTGQISPSVKVLQRRQRPTPRRTRSTAAAEFVEGLIPVLKQMEGGALGRPGAVARKFSEGLDQTLDGWGKTDAHGLGFAGEKLILMSAGLPK